MNNQFKNLADSITTEEAIELLTKYPTALKGFAATLQNWLNTKIDQDDWECRLADYVFPSLKPNN